MGTKLDQIDLGIVKLLKLTKNDILSNFDLYSRKSKSDIFCVPAVTNSRMCTVSSSYPE